MDPSVCNSIAECAIGKLLIIGSCLEMTITIDCSSKTATRIVTLPAIGLVILAAPVVGDQKPMNVRKTCGYYKWEANLKECCPLSLTLTLSRMVSSLAAVRPVFTMLIPLNN
ncbi:hypothetical protein D918_02274 [Trichuris suis]|nr:hypothetical protein D918_02274 [Trichuris suis]